MAVKVRSEDRKPRTIWEDLGSWVDQSGQNWAHGAQQLASFSDDVNRYLGFGPSNAGPTALLRGLGSTYREPAAGPGRRAGSRQPGTKAVPATQATPAMTFADYLALARQYMDESGGGGPDYSAAAEALRQQALQADAKLAAMHNQLRSSIQADAPTIQGQYDQGIASVGQNADQAAANVNAAYQEARDAQSRQLAALGIEDAAAVLAAQGGNAAADQAHAVGNIEQGRATGQNQLTQNRSSALNYNTNIGNAASLAGVESRGALANSLQNALADLATRQSEARAGSGRSVLDLAMQLQQQDQGDPQALADFLYQQQRDQASDVRSSQENSQRVFMQLVEQYDGDLTKASQAFAQLQAAGIV